MNVIPIIFKSVLMKIIGFLKRILKIPVQIILRRLVHWDFFWYQSLQYTWGKKIPQVKPGDVFRYKLASMAKGFDNDFLSFVSAQNISPKKKTDLAFTGAEENVILRILFKNPMIFMRTDLKIIGITFINFFLIPSSVFVKFN